MSLNKKLERCGILEISFLFFLNDIALRITVAVTLKGKVPSINQESSSWSNVSTKSGRSQADTNNANEPLLKGAVLMMYEMIDWGRGIDNRLNK